MPKTPQSVHRILLVTGGPNHDCPSAAQCLTDTLKQTGRFRVTAATLASADSGRGIPELAGLPGSSYDAVVLYVQVAGQLPQKQLDGLQRFVEAGGGLVAIHGALASFPKSPEYQQLLGAKVARRPKGAFAFTVRYPDAAKAAGHPIIVRTEPFALRDELFILQPLADLDVFATAHYQGADYPLGYTRKHGAGIVIGLANGRQGPDALGERHFLRMVERSVRVACGETFPGVIRAATLGYGPSFNMGKQHAESINAQFGMKTIGVCDIDPGRTAAAKTELGSPLRTYSHMDELFADDEVDLVVVILPHHLHAPACIKASQAGKHVITEKPFCVTLEDADAMIAAAGTAGRMLTVYHNRRWDGDFLKLLHIVRSGAIGDVFHAEAGSAGYHEPGTWWRSDKKISGGVLYDWGAHYGDWLLNLMNQRIASVSGNVQKRHWRHSTNEDFAQVFVRFADDTTGTLEQGSLAAIGRPGWRILGTKGGLANPGPHAEITMVDYTLPGNLRRETKIAGGPGASVPFYNNIANHLLMGETLVVTPQQARRAIGILRLAELSSAQGGKPLELPGEDRFDPASYMMPW